MIFSDNTKGYKTTETKRLDEPELFYLSVERIRAISEEYSIEVRQDMYRSGRPHMLIEDYEKLGIDVKHNANGYEKKVDITFCSRVDLEKIIEGLQRALDMMPTSDKATTNKVDPTCQQS